MTNGRPPLTGRDAAGAGALMLAVNLFCAGIGAGLGALAGSVPAGLLPGFFIGFVLAIFVVAKRFRDF
jgi:F0F1-type ATP synthase assembly protein I